MRFAEGLLLPGEIREAVKSATDRIDSWGGDKCCHSFQGSDGLHLLMVERRPDGAVEVFELADFDCELVRLTA
jgi:hypothetical protein